MVHEKVTIYHNPRCGKSRQTLKLLEERGIEPEVVEYLKTPLTKGELKRVLGQLGIKAGELVRKKEKVFKDLGLDAATASEAALIDAMAKHPILMERPIVVKGEKAALGRPPENVLEIL